MDLYIDLKYLLLLSFRLEKYKRKSEYLWNFRCPFCGDSSTSKSKARGYIFRDKKDPNRLSFRCHNCQSRNKFSFFLKRLDESLYREYRLEQYRPSNREATKFIIPPVAPPLKKLEFESAVRCDLLTQEHKCIEYLKFRKIPEKFWNKLYYTDNYSDFVLECLPDYDKELAEDSRLIIPYFNSSGDIIAVTGRAFTDKTIRYITIRIQDGDKMIYGLDRLDNSKKCYIVEGPLDSLFLPNAIASGDSNLMAVARSISAYKVVLIFDNERRNKENINQLEKAILGGHTVVVWPDTMKEKDINQMIMSGKTESEILDIIDRNTVSGLSALIKVKFWKRT